jgi:hypothetical protein
LWRVMPLKTPFGLLIGFITVLQVVTTITYYTLTHLHSLQSLHSNIPILFGAFGIHLETAERQVLGQRERERLHLGWGQETIFPVLKVPRQCPLVLLV